MRNEILVSIVLAVILEYSNSETLQEKEINCYAQEKVYHEQSDKCYKLLTRGPCPKGQWFVLDKPSELQTDVEANIKPVCINEKCADKQYYWASTGECVKGKDKDRLCGTSTEEELLNNIFGEGECLCKREPPRARLNGDKKNPCYPLYTQGPCPRGKILGFKDGDEDLDEERATCIDDPCHKETAYRKRLGTLKADGVLAAWENGTCYELGTQGPCPESVTFKVHASYKKPSCVLLTNSIFDLEKPQNCYQDENGDCQKRISTNKHQNAEKYRVELFNSISAARKRRTIRPYDQPPRWTAHYH